MKIKEYVETYKEICEEVEDKDLAIAILQEIGKDQRQSKIPINPLNNLATEKQIKFLKGLGVEVKEGLTKQEAFKLIQENKK